MSLLVSSPLDLGSPAHNHAHSQSCTLSYVLTVFANSAKLGSSVRPELCCAYWSICLRADGSCSSIRRNKLAAVTSTDMEELMEATPSERKDEDTVRGQGTVVE